MFRLKRALAAMAMPIPGAIRSNAADQFPTSCGGSEILSRAAAKIEVILIFRAQNAFRSASGKSVRSRRESNLAELRHRADRTIGDVRARSSRASPCDEPLCCVTSRRLIPARIRRTPQPVHGEGARPERRHCDGEPPVDALESLIGLSVPQAQNLPLAARPRVGHIGLVGDVAEWLKAAVC